MVMNFEARGNTGPVLMFETSDSNGWYMNEFKKAAPYPVAYSFSYDVYKSMPNNTDFTLFKEAGCPGFNFALLEGSETYHNSNDTPKNLNQQSLQQEGSYALSLIKHFGNLTLTNKKTSNAIYFSLTKSIFVLYSEKWAAPLAILAFILFVIVFALGLNNKLLSFRGTIIGTLLNLFIIGISVGIGIIANIIFTNLYYKQNQWLAPDELKTIQEKANLWIIALIILILAIVCLLYWFADKKVSYINLLNGSMFIGIILTLVSGFLLKASSYIFTWTTIFIFVALLFQFVLKSRKKIDCGYYILMIFTIFSSILIYTPPIFLFYEAMGMQLAGALAGIVVLPLSNIVLSSLLTMKNSSCNHIINININNNKFSSEETI
jgi:hypothetical protein